MERRIDNTYLDIARKSDSVVGIIEGNSKRPHVVYRMSGSDYLLLEYGEMTLDLNLRVRIYLLEQTIKNMNIEGILELAPGVRSLLIHYNGLRLPLNRLIEVLKLIEDILPSNDEVEIPSRRVALPIACHDKWTREAIEKYMTSIRAEGPYLPDNVDFIARCNGLSSIDDVIRSVLSTEYIVIGLGDVYLGAPCAVPLDPRHTLIVPKYNPARTWTPEGSVGIGGAFMCIYPMESPGGYQLVGRTLPIWNTWQTNAAFKNSPWLLRPFDRIKFELVSESELEEYREAVISNRYEFRIEDDIFKIREYNEFLRSVENEAKAFKLQQQRAVELATIGY